MNAPFSSFATDHERLRKETAYGILDQVCKELEPLTSDVDLAKASYESVADWLSRSTNPVLQRLWLYAHGSTALGTTVRPLGRDDFDVDLICLVHGITPVTEPSVLKQLIGNRLREHRVYAAMLEEKKRCWRINYARAFHLDISPTIANPACRNGGELVPDKAVRSWKPTNPVGYRKLFERRCQLEPRFRLSKAIAADSMRTDIEPFSERKARKGILRRTVQLAKRHRDIIFQDVSADIAPISIIITTLAAQAYEFCVERFVFETELDVVIATIRMMPHFIERPVVHGRAIYLVANETTEGENFAERWNSEPERARAFHEWHQRALADFERLASLEGMDVVTSSMSSILGEGVVRKVMDARTSAVSAARSANKLFVAPAVGLSLTKHAGALEVPRNTNFGDRRP